METQGLSEEKDRGAICYIIGVCFVAAALATWQYPQRTEQLHVDGTGRLPQKREIMIYKTKCYNNIIGSKWKKLCFVRI